MTTTLPATDRDSSSRWRRVKGPTLVAAGLLGASVLLHVRDPHGEGSFGFCPWLVATGTYCPGCGGLRAVNDLTNAELTSAVSSNAFFVGAIPLALFSWSRWMQDRWRGTVRRLDERRALRFAVVFLGVAVAFAVVRNLSFAAWLAP